MEEEEDKKEEEKEEEKKREEESVTLDTTEGDRPDKAVKAKEHSAQRQAERS